MPVQERRDDEAGLCQSISSTFHLFLLGVRHIFTVKPQKQLEGGMGHWWPKGSGPGGAEGAEVVGGFCCMGVTVLPLCLQGQAAISSGSAGS